MNFSLDKYLADLRPLINVDCGTLQTTGIATIAAYFSNEFSALDWNVKHVDCGIAGSGLEIRNHPEKDHIDVLIIGHMDTVFPVGTAEARPMTVDHENAYGPGVSDMKSGLLNVLYALRNLDKKTQNTLSICVIMNPDEEIGSLHSEAWIKSVAQQASYVLVAEAARANGALVKARKGMARYRLDFHGKAAHAGNDPHNGRSAITEMAHWILEINKLTNFKSGTTLNVGVVQGGCVSNIVPDHAQAIIDVRFWDNKEYDDVNRQLNTWTQYSHLEGVTITLEREAHKPAMTASKNTKQLMKWVEMSGKAINLDIQWQEVGGGSDANLTAALGIPTLDGFGPIGAGFHSDGEYLQLNSIEPRIKLLQGVLNNIAQHTEKTKSTLIQNERI
jgi:glutamate carboxypeptidase